MKQIKIEGHHISQEVHYNAYGIYGYFPGLGTHLYDFFALVVLEP